MKKLSDKIVSEIKEKKIRPKPKWIFLLKDYFIWSIFGISVVIGGLAFVVILFLLTTNDWDVYKHLGRDPSLYFLTMLPRIWIGTLILFLLIAYYNYRHTKKGHRYKTYVIVLGSVLGSVVIGTVLFFTGLGSRIEESFASVLPYYGGFMEHRMKIWTQPQKGLLAGEIIKVKSKNILLIEDFKKNVWKVDISNALWRRRRIVGIGDKIKIIGVEKSGNVFIAREIRPWIGRRGNLEYNDDSHHGNGRGYGGNKSI